MLLNLHPGFPAAPPGSRATLGHRAEEKGSSGASLQFPIGQGPSAVPPPEFPPREGLPFPFCGVPGPPSRSKVVVLFFFLQKPFKWKGGSNLKRRWYKNWWWIQNNGNKFCWFSILNLNIVHTGGWALAAVHRSSFSSVYCIFPKKIIPWISPPDVFSWPLRPSEKTRISPGCREVFYHFAPMRHQTSRRTSPKLCSTWTWWNKQPCEK